MLIINNSMVTLLRQSVETLSALTNKWISKGRIKQWVETKQGLKSVHPTVKKNKSEDCKNRNNNGNNNNNKKQQQTKKQTYTTNNTIFPPKPSSCWNRKWKIYRTKQPTLQRSCTKTIRQYCHLNINIYSLTFRCIAGLLLVLQPEKQGDKSGRRQGKGEKVKTVWSNKIRFYVGVGGGWGGGGGIITRDGGS